MLPGSRGRTPVRRPALGHTRCAARWRRRKSRARARTDDPSWDGTYATVKDPAGEHAESLALVEFRRCISAKLGAPNDEVFHGHALAGKGLDAYSAQLVRRSRWLAELQKTNSVHSAYRAESWQNRNHYVFWFHDSTFECIAESFTVERHACSMSALLGEACRRLVR